MRAAVVNGSLGVRVRRRPRVPRRDLSATVQSGDDTDFPTTALRDGGWSRRARRIEARSAATSSAGTVVSPRSSRGRGCAGDDVPMSTTPHPSRHARITGEDRRELAAAPARRYHDGQSIGGICSEAGYSIARVRALLTHAGVVFRGLGGPRPRPARQ